MLSQCALNRYMQRYADTSDWPSCFPLAAIVLYFTLSWSGAVVHSDTWPLTINLWSQILHPGGAFIRGLKGYLVLQGCCYRCVSTFNFYCSFLTKLFLPHELYNFIDGRYKTLLASCRGQNFLTGGPPVCLHLEFSAKLPCECIV